MVLPSVATIVQESGFQESGGWKPGGSLLDELPAFRYRFLG
jgi:hypothetical protein